MKNIPKKIFLQIGDFIDLLDYKESDYNEIPLGEVTWCVNKIHDYDIEYHLATNDSKPIDELIKEYEDSVDLWIKSFSTASNEITKKILQARLEERQIFIEKLKGLREI